MLEIPTGNLLLISSKLPTQRVSWTRLLKNETSREMDYERLSVSPGAG